MICLSLILHVLLSLPVEEKAEGGWLRWWGWFYALSVVVRRRPTA